MEEIKKENKFKKVLSAVVRYMRSHVSDVAAYAGLVLCLIVFTITSNGRLWSSYNFSVLTESVCVWFPKSGGYLSKFARLRSTISTTTVSPACTCVSG